MDNQEWLQRWQDENIGFHASEPNLLLKAYLPKLSLVPGDTIFVPLCGASVDMAYCLEQGLKVVGCELSNIACQRFFTEHNLPFDMKSIGTFDCYYNDNIALYCGDLFELTPDITGEMHGIYDRAALIALAPAQREAYVNILRTLVPNDNTLLITITHDDASGPPYPVAEHDVRSLFNLNTVILLKSCSDTPAAKHLMQRGKTNVQEHIFHVK